MNIFKVSNLLIYMFFSFACYYSMAALNQNDQTILTELQKHLQGMTTPDAKSQGMIAIPYFINRYIGAIASEDIKNALNDIRQQIMCTQHDFRFDESVKRVDLLLSEGDQGEVVCNACNITKRSPDSFFLYPCRHQICLECVDREPNCLICFFNQPSSSTQNMTPCHSELNEDIGLSLLTNPKICPNLDCNTCFEYEGAGYAKCPVCSTEFCTNCEVSHTSLSCADYFQTLDEEDKKHLTIKRCCKKDQQHSQDQMIECEICFDQIPYNHLALLPCEHNICACCLIDYLSTTENIKSERGQQYANCPGIGCDAKIPHNAFILIFSSQKLSQKSLNEFHLTGGGRYCPYGCETIISSDDVAAYTDSPRPFHCQLCNRGGGCLLCGEKEFHKGYTCDEFKNKDIVDAESNLELLNKMDALPCPRCKIMATKEYCNRVSCLCGYEFCWKCGGQWRNVKQGNPYDKKVRNCTCHYQSKKRDRTLSIQDVIVRQKPAAERKAAENQENQPASSGILNFIRGKLFGSK